MPTLFRRIRALFSRERLDHELDEEMGLHLERLVTRFRDEGLDEAEARRRARIEFGPAQSLREEARDARGLRLLEELGRDVRIGVRTLVRRPGFAVSVILTLAVGIGANVAVFSVVHAVLLRPFAYPAREPDRVLLIAEQSPQGERMSVSYPPFRDWVEQLESFESLSGVVETIAPLTRIDDSVRVRISSSSSSAR